MSSFLKALSKVGLVELEEGEIDASRPSPPAPEVDLDALAADIASLENQLGTTETAPSAPVTPPLADSSSTDVVENIPFDDIYQAAQVKAAPFSAEKLLKLLGGLAAMDEATRKAAVIAMDQADEAWSIEDPLLDAQRKMRALDGHAQSLQMNLRATQEAAEADLAARDTYQEEATETIRGQIAELEATLAQELATVAKEKAEIQARAEAAQQAALREQSRLQAEKNRLGEILKVFGSVVSEPTDD